MALIRSHVEFVKLEKKIRQKNLVFFFKQKTTINLRHFPQCPTLAAGFRPAENNLGIYLVSGQRPTGYRPFAVGPESAA